VLRLIFISWFLILVFTSCNKGNITESYNYERDTPFWLKEKIDSMSVNQLYYGAKVYRYTCEQELRVPHYGSNMVLRIL